MNLINDRRLAAVEGSVASLHSKVSLTAGNGGPVHDPQALASIGAASDIDHINADDQTVESQDPTDGIGSIVFTKEEDSGFFGWW